MSAVVYQRYLLLAIGSPVSIPASSTAGITTTSVNVPLSGSWTIRLRQCVAALAPNDASGQLQILSGRCFYNLLSSTGTVLFQVFGPVIPSWVTPAFQFPTSAIAVSLCQDPIQTISSLDQVGGVVSQVQAVSEFNLHNIDAANPHSAHGVVQGIIEFEKAGSSDF
jgi:hypothetical protein